jgi:hypothetical protein
MDDITEIAAEEEFAYSPKRLAVLENCCISEVYNRLGRGEYEGLKDGRKTLITWRSVVARRRKVLKPATYARPSRKTPEGRP